MRNHTVRLTLAALLAAFCFLGTQFLKIPVPSPNGYVHLGDSMVLLAGFLLGWPYGALAAALGSMLADLLSGYAVYALPTFLIKGGVAICACGMYRLLRGRGEGRRRTVAAFAAATLAELLMTAGYFVFEGFYYASFATALLAVPGNLVQGAFGTLSAVPLYFAACRSGLLRKWHTL